MRKKTKLERELRALEDAREARAKLVAGGTPARPIVVTSASVVELTAEALGCARCEGTLRAEDHDAPTVDGLTLRRVRARCRACGAVREVWLRIAALN